MRRASKIYRHLLAIIGVIILFTNPILAQNKDQISKQDVKKKIDFLNQYFNQLNAWHTTDTMMARRVQELINFINDEPINNVITDLKEINSNEIKYIDRLPNRVKDSLRVENYYSKEEIDAEIAKLKLEIEKKHSNLDVVIPDHIFDNMGNEVKTIPAGEGEVLFQDSIYTLPEELRVTRLFNDSTILSPIQYKQKLYIDSLRNNYIESKRIEYNNQLVKAYQDSVISSYRNNLFNKEFASRKKALLDRITLNNYHVLADYNEEVVSNINDSIQTVLQDLISYAEKIDTTKITIRNSVGNNVDFTLSNKKRNNERLWLKNDQNDSINISISNPDRNSLQLNLDDDVRISRFKQTENKQIKLTKTDIDNSDFNHVGDVYKIATLWRIGGDGNVGFTQTYLDNWKKGGKSAFSLLVNLKGFANYATLDDKIKWDNNIELLSGWIQPGGSEAEVQKNDDKIELTSRFGLNAFQKWYYSSELTIESQIFDGYDYPVEDGEKPISAFLSPVKTFFKIGLDYKPTPNFSLLLSPLTIKHVYVNDTVNIDQTRYGIEKGKKSFFEPGMNIDLKWKKNITNNITFNTKYKMFINYSKPLEEYDINWENYLNMQLTKFINMRMMVHLIYDDDVLFPIYKMEGGDKVKVGEEPRLQVKELFTIGFSYKINRRVQRSFRLD